MKSLTFWLWLASVEGAHARLLDSWPDDPLTALDELRRADVLTPQREKQWKANHQSNWAEAEEERLDQLGYSALAWDDPAYPEALRDLAEPPAVLYLRGRWPDNPLSVGVVGTRRCSAYGAECARQLGSALSAAGVTVVSGGAAGIDGQAHEGALEGGTPTVAVFGTGLDQPWPRNHLDLFDRVVAEGGALVTEYPLGTQGRPWRFPRRNRLIAALGNPLIVVESGIKGGAMITARLAGDLGREVWAVPGRIDQGVSAGSNRLLFEGAQPLIDVQEAVELLTGVKQMELFSPEMESDERLVYEALSRQADRTADSLSMETGLNGLAVLAALSGLEMKGLIRSAGAGRWQVRR